MAIKHDEKWKAEKRALKKVQMHFSFKDELNKQLRLDAVEDNINPSDYIRKIVGLSYQKIQRPRIGLSFNADDLQMLAERYGLDSTDEKEIKRRVMDEVNVYYAEKNDET